MIADEPTKGLDAVIRNQVYSVLRQIYTEHHCSMLVITHDLALARRLCDDIRVLYMGRIIEQGTAEEVMERPRRPDPLPAQPGHGAHTAPGPRTAGAHRLPLLPPLPQGHGALRPGGAGGGHAAHGREGEVLPL